jgi:membrane-associated phospholipid phosphatase
MRDFFATLPRNFFKSFTGKRFYLHLLGIALTALIVLRGFDWYWYKTLGASPIEDYFFPAVVIGGILPIFIPLFLVMVGYILKSVKVRMTGWALAQAALLGLVISSLYKAFTGRVQPIRGDFLTDISRQFQFGFLEHGVFWGWPSSHTTVAFAMSVTLCIMYRKNRLLCAVALLYATYIGLGISMNIHWFSEFIAGSLIGTAVGLAVGKHFHQYTNS